ncbi:MFS transporter [Microbacterium phosphatis]|uniref:MFS transporter n=1 Tax=Microbacterium phosphatis TaxID=3140248 RepID=UPI003140516E
MRPAQVIQAISGLMAAMFVVLISSTVVATPMPKIMADLNGTNTEYTWVLVAAFLTMTVTTPIWGKLSDIFNRKLLLQIALVIFVLATVAAGFAGQIGGDSHEGGATWLISWRFVQAIGTGGLMALGQVVIADIIAPRERGKYMGIMGAVMAVGQIAGPLLGGVIADSWGWEWCFFVGVPIAVVAFIMMQATLKVSNVTRPVRVDFMGIGFVVASIGVLMIWIMFGGKPDEGGFEWNSAMSFVLAGAGVFLAAAAIVTEFRAKAVEPSAPGQPRPVKLDLVGAAFIVAGISLILVWISLGGKPAAGGFEWDSEASITMAAVGVLFTIGAIVTQFVVAEPIIPLRLFRQGTFALSSIASVAVGVTMFGTSVFLAQYLQYARGFTPTDAGLATIPMVIGSMAGSIVVGQLISRTGKWKGYVIAGAVILTGGLIGMSTLHYDTPMGAVWSYMFLLGLGSGVLMQNLVLVVQNSLPPSMLGAGSGAIAFFRSLGGTVGVTVLGSILGTQVGDKIKTGLEELVAKIDPSLGIPELLAQNPDCADSLEQMTSGNLPDVAALCEPVRTVVESGYGDSIANLFFLVVPLAIVTLVCTIFLPNKPLSRKTAAQQIEEELGAELSALEPAEKGGAGFRELVESGAIVLPEDELPGARRSRRSAPRPATDTGTQTAAPSGSVAVLEADDPDEDILTASEPADAASLEQTAAAARLVVTDAQEALERARIAFAEVEGQVAAAGAQLAEYDRRTQDALRQQADHAREVLEAARRRHDDALGALSGLPESEHDS